MTDEEIFQRLVACAMEVPNDADYAMATLRTIVPGRVTKKFFNEFDRVDFIIRIENSFGIKINMDDEAWSNHNFGDFASLVRSKLQQGG